MTGVQPSQETMMTQFGLFFFFLSLGKGAICAPMYLQKRYRDSNQLTFLKVLVVKVPELNCLY